VLTVVALLAGLVLIGWCAFVFLLWWQQDRLVFAGWGFGLVASSGIGPNDERLEITTPDGVRLVGALRRAERPSRGLLLVFGGNAEDSDWRLRHLEGWLDDVDVVTFFYRGFGPSGGAPNQAALVADATLIYDHVVTTMQPRRVIVGGCSLGSGVVAQLARARPLAGAILLTPFDSITEVAADRYRLAPVRRLLRHPFRSDEALAGLDVPVAVIAADGDTLVTPERTRRLVAVLARPVLVAWIAGADHVSIYERPEYRTAFTAALDLLLGSQSSAAASDTLRRAVGV
jgi:pimeloyl-ACP methyl ester carboxylesterase